MTPSFDPRRSEEMRALLIAQAAPRPRRRPGVVIALLVSGALAGAGASTAAFAATGSLTAPAIAQPSGEPRPDLPDAIAAPPGTVPGAPLVSLVGIPTTKSLSAPLALPISERPEGATHLRVTITPLSAGGVNWGTDPGGNNPSATFTRTDVDGEAALTWYDFPLDDSTDVFHVTPSDGLTASVTFQYLNKTPTLLGRNAAGQTFGVEGGPEGVPDLVRVSGVSPEGAAIEGYALSAELNAFSPDHLEQPSTPEEAHAWQEARDEEYPHGWDIPVYESDGVTRIGTFHIG
ncbi:hypothetical protein [Streptomyces sp. AC495_CC817]|uniref:hypothetical protein n=1 Tax=Streptomyces sp. AC495_CC817 TaxID=2823900 RepID=UPI001C25FD42|nr:hypothetical protein [Streptomyces sp. AC495_CC817]